MEATLLTYASLSVFTLIIAFKFFSQLRSQRRRNLPPSPPALPVIGHLHLLKPPLHRTFHRISQNLGSVFSLRFGSRLVVVVSSPSAVEECFAKNDVVLANRPPLIGGKYMGYNYTSVVDSPYGDHWRNLRRLMSLEIFSTTRLNASLSVRKDEIKLLIRNLYRNSSADFAKVELKSKFSELSFNIIMRMIAGKRYYGEDLENHEEAKQFRGLVSETFEYGGASNPNDFSPVLRWIDYGNFEKNLGRIHKRMDALLQGLIDEHRSDKSRNSMIDHLPSLQESQPEYYTDAIIRGLILMFQHNTDINFMSETSREQNTQSSDNHFISETSRVSRGKAFTIIEDETLCRCWLAVSQDPITGNSQTMTIFWERVLVNFNSQFTGESTRNRISLSHRWSAMQKAINKFCGFLEQIQLRQQSGTTEADMVAEAKRMYHAIQKKHFTFDTCWDILRRSCKWDEFRTQSKKSTQHAYPCSNPPTGESDALQSNQNNVLHEQASNPSTRPIGTKAAKEKLKNQTTHDSRFDEMAANQSKIVEVLSTISARTIERDEQKAIDREQKAADRRRRAEDREEQLKLLSMMNEREQRNEDHKLMSMDMTNLNPMQRAYYEDLQRQILFRTTNRLP